VTVRDFLARFAMIATSLFVLAARPLAQPPTQQTSTGLQVRCFRIVSPMPEKVLEILKPRFPEGINLDFSALGVVASSFEHQWSGEELERIDGVQSCFSDQPANEELTFLFKTGQLLPYLERNDEGRFALREGIFPQEFSVAVTPIGNEMITVWMKLSAPSEREAIPDVTLSVGKPKVVEAVATRITVKNEPVNWNAFLLHEKSTPECFAYYLVFVLPTQIVSTASNDAKSDDGAKYWAEARVLRIPFEPNQPAFDESDVSKEFMPLRGRAQFVPQLTTELPQSTVEEGRFPSSASWNVQPPRNGAPTLFKLIVPDKDDQKILWSRDPNVKIDTPTPAVGGFGGGASSTVSNGSKLPDPFETRPVLREFIHDLTPCVTILADLHGVHAEEEQEEDDSKNGRVNTLGPFGTFLAFSGKPDPNRKDFCILEFAYSDITERNAVLESTKGLRKTRVASFPSEREFRFQVPVQVNTARPVAFTYIDDVTGDRIVILTRLFFSEPNSK
jgi:hypothetical protein